MIKNQRAHTAEIKQIICVVVREMDWFISAKVQAIHNVITFFENYVAVCF